jgi:hypothetical protein
VGSGVHQEINFLWLFAYLYCLHENKPAAATLQAFFMHAIVRWLGKAGELR